MIFGKSRLCVYAEGELISKGMGYEYAGMERTLDSHIKNLRRKIGVNLIQTVYGVGYKLVEVAEEG